MILPAASSHAVFNLDLLNSVSEGLVPLISSKSRAYLLQKYDPVGLSMSRSVELSIWTALIGRTGFDTMYSIPDPTLSLS